MNPTDDIRRILNVIDNPKKSLTETRGIIKENRNEAFRQARLNGEMEFTYDGKRYHTRRNFESERFHELKMKSIREGLHSLSADEIEYMLNHKHNGQLRGLGNEERARLEQRLEHLESGGSEADRLRAQYEEMDDERLERLLGIYLRSDDTDNLHAQMIATILGERNNMSPEDYVEQMVSQRQEQQARDSVPQLSRSDVGRLLRVIKNNPDSNDAEDARDQLYELGYTDEVIEQAVSQMQ